VAEPTRDDALRALREGHARIDELLGGLSEEQLARPATIGGGDWSAKDLIGHLATWEELALRSMKEFQEGEKPWVESPAGPFSAPATGKVDAFNAAAVAEKQAQTLADVRRGAANVHDELVRRIAAMSEEEWVSKASYETPNRRRRKLCTLLGSILGAPQQPFGHAFAHIPDLEAYAGSLGPPAPAP
jgi:hypothetical protein